MNSDVVHFDFKPSQLTSTEEGIRGREDVLIKEVVDEISAMPEENVVNGGRKQGEGGLGEVGDA